jgi:hypothetical protein
MVSYQKIKQLLNTKIFYYRLNEGFASYIEFKGMTAAEPTWEMEDHFTTDTMHSVLDLDATLGEFQNSKKINSY